MLPTKRWISVMTYAFLLHEYGLPWKPYVRKEYNSCSGNAKKCMERALKWTDVDLDKAAGLVCRS